MIARAMVDSMKQNPTHPMPHPSPCVLCSIWSAGNSTRQLTRDLIDAVPEQRALGNQGRGPTMQKLQVRRPAFSCVCMLLVLHTKSLRGLGGLWLSTATRKEGASSVTP